MKTKLNSKNADKSRSILHEFLASHSHNSGSTCKSDEIMCISDGRCIEAYHYCNGLQDCDDGTDEDQCSGV